MPALEPLKSPPEPSPASLGACRLRDAESPEHNFLAARLRRPDAEPVQQTPANSAAIAKWGRWLDSAAAVSDQAQLGQESQILIALVGGQVSTHDMLRRRGCPADRPSADQLAAGIRFGAIRGSRFGRFEWAWAEGGVGRSAAGRFGSRD